MALSLLQATDHLWSMVTSPRSKTTPESVQQSTATGSRSHDSWGWPTASSDSNDSTGTNVDCPEVDPAALELASQHIAAFAGPQDFGGACGFALTCGLWVGSFLLGRWLLPRLSLTWWGVALAGFWLLLRAGSSVRVYVQMHDLTHGSTFKKRWMNEWGAALTALMNPVDPADYRRVHSQHHANTGMEDEADPQHTVLWTTNEWAAWPAGPSKAAARVLFDPLFFFSLWAPIYEVCLNQAWPHMIKNTTLTARYMYALRRTVLAVAQLAAFYYFTGTPLTIAMADLLASQVALSYGMFMFHIQHVWPHRGVYRAPKAQHDRAAAGLLGSSYLSVPWWWRWATMGIEYHHIHHCNARVPGYRLQECHESAPAGLWESVGVQQLGAREGVHALLLSLWDPQQRCYVPFPAWRWAADLLTPTHAHT